MAKFRCKHSGTVLEFKEEFDIVQMRKHDEYEEVFESKEDLPPKIPKEIKKVVK